MRDISIAFKASDGLTQSVKNMRKSVDGLSRDVTEYRKIQDEAFNKKTEVKFEITQAKKDLKELEKAVKQNAEGSEKAFKEKQKALEQLNEEYRRLTKVAKDASKAELKLQDDMHKSKNYASTMKASSGNFSKDLSSTIEAEKTTMLKSLAGAGLGNMLGNSLANAGGQMVSSLYGDVVGSAVGNIAGGIATGAAMGSVAGPIGAAVGAAVGGISGSINTMVQQQASTDEIFRSEVKNLYDLVKNEQAMSLARGKVSAGQFEKDMISYGTMLGGDANAERFLNDITAFSSATPFTMDSLLGTSKKLLSYKYGQDDIIPLMTAIGDAGSALGMSSQDMDWVATSLGRMKSSNKTTLEYINALEERAVPAVDYLAKSFGKSNAEVREMISKGLIPGAEAAKTIADAMGEQFAGNMAKQSKTLEGLTSTLSDTWAQFDKSMGMGYAEERKKGLTEEIAALTGARTDLGGKMHEAYSLIGEYQASLENAQRKSVIDAMTGAMESVEFDEAKLADDGAKMGGIIWAAKVDAELKYKQTEEYQMMHDADLQLVKDIQGSAAINDAYLEYGKRMGEQFSKGYYAGVQIADIAPGKVHVPYYAKDMVQSKEEASLEEQIFKQRNGFATGIDRVPYNNMPAFLHEGERVLTKVEADKIDKGSGSGVTININNPVVKENADVDRILSDIASKMRKYAINTA